MNKIKFDIFTLVWVVGFLIFVFTKIKKVHREYTKNRVVKNPGFSQNTQRNRPHQTKKAPVYAGAKFVTKNNTPEAKTRKSYTHEIKTRKSYTPEFKTFDSFSDVKNDKPKIVVKKRGALKNLHQEELKRLYIWKEVLEKPLALRDIQ